MKFMLILLMAFLAFPEFLNCQKVGENKAMQDKISTVTFCEMVKNPNKYFDKKIRITATFIQATEAQYLGDEDNCPLSHDDQIGVGYSEADKSELAAIRESIEKINSPEFGSRAIVTVVGILRNKSRRDFAWYQYRFDILEFEDISQVIVEYNQELVGQTTYRAEVQKDKLFGINFVKPFRLPFHYAMRIEWTNLNEFPQLKNFEKQKIVFTVLTKEIKQMTENRWNVTIKCKIIRLE